jgi:hypothetical protein
MHTVCVYLSIGSNYKAFRVTKEERLHTPDTETFIATKHVWPVEILQKRYKIVLARITVTA